MKILSSQDTAIIKTMRIPTEIRSSAHYQVDFKGNGISIKIQHNKIWKRVFKERSVWMQMVQIVWTLDKCVDMFHPQSNLYVL